MSREVAELLLLMGAAWIGGLLFLTSVQVLRSEAKRGARVLWCASTALLFVGCISLVSAMT